MKKNVFLILAAALILSAISCERIEEVDEPDAAYTYTACMPEENEVTRTALGNDGKTVTWTESDDIVTYWYDGEWKNQNNKPSTISEDGKAATINTSESVTWAATPYPNSAFYNFLSCSGDSFNISLNKQQTAHDFKFANIMVAKASGSKLDFRHVCGIFCFKTTNDGDEAVYDITTCAPGICGKLKISCEGGKTKVETPEEGRGNEITTGFYGYPGKAYIAVRPGTYKAGELCFQIYGKSSKLIATTYYNKDLTVTPGMLVDWGNIYKYHKDTDVAYVPDTYLSDISKAAGNKDNVKEITFVANSPGEAGAGESVMNPDGPGPAIYISDSYGKVTLRSAAKRFYHFSWGFDNYSNLEAVNGLENIEFVGVKNLYGMFRNTKLTSFDFSKINSFATIKSLENMFSGCTSLKEVKMDGADLSNVTDLGSMFAGCTALEKVSLKNVDMSGVTNMYSMFSCCTALSDVNFTGVTTRDVTSMRFMFSKCYELSSVDMSSFTTPNLTSTEHMFGECKKLTSVNLDGFNAENITSLDYMFYLCESLATIDLSSFKTPSLLNCRYMFDHCPLLASIDISNLNTSKTSSFTAMFRGCKKLTKLDLTNFDTSSATSFNDMFNDCICLADLDISTFTTPSMTDCAGMFWTASSLKELDLSKFDLSKVTKMSNMFDGTKALATLTLGKKFAFQGDFSKVFGVSLMGSGNTSSEYYTTIHCSDSQWSRISEILGSNISHYRHIAPALANFKAIDPFKIAFKKAASKLADPGAPADVNGVANGNHKVKTITFTADSEGAKRSDEETFSADDSAYPIYGSVDNSGNMTIRTPGPGFKLPEDSKYFFSSGTSATTTTAVNGSTLSGLTRIDGLENISTDGVTSMNHMFSKCTSLTAIDLSHFQTSSVTDFNYMFSGCTSLQSADMTSFMLKGEDVDFSRVFENCSSLTSVNMLSFNSTIKSISRLFYNCTHLATVSVGPKFSTTDKVCSNAFYNMGSANTEAEYWTTVTCGEYFKSLLQSQSGDNFVHYRWISND